MPDIDLEREAIALFEQLLDVAEAERDDWIASHTVDQPELRARLKAMRQGDRVASLRTGSAAEEIDEEAAPEQVGAYRLTERIGRGGMGSVYRGERVTGDFKHIVAVKIIKPGLLSETLVERFARERQILAELSHPNIAQLYDGGETEAGSPYLIMELVDGLPLLQWADAHVPSRADRQRLFRDICGAVSFAHRNLIVHRDLTPSNVLVTRDGMVKLIDFGIAKPADDPAGGVKGPVSIGSLSLTPGYAAPERSTSSEVTTAADIYSLGKLLQKLIPSGSDDSDLNAIIARATAADPQGRYATVDSLSADVAAWQGNMPVVAAGGGRSYIWRKFIARHRVGVAATAGALALLIGAFGMTLFANARAETARVNAERRFEQTRAIAKVMMFDALAEVSKVPGSTKARELLARSGLTYIDALARDPNAPFDVRHEAGRGYIRLARVMGGQTSQLGKGASANTLLAKAEAILRPLYAARPADPEVRRSYADLLLEQAGGNLYNNNEPALARKQTIEAQNVLARIARDDPASAMLYATAIQTEGDSYGWDDDYAKARPVYFRGEKFMADLPPALRESPGVMAARSATLRLLGEAHHELKEEPQAEAALERAVAINRALVALQTDDPRNIRKLAISLWNRAVILRANKKDAAAQASINEAIVNTQILTARDPKDAGAVELFATVGEVKAQLLADMKQFPASFTMSDEVIAAFRRLVVLGDNSPGKLRSLASALITRGGSFYNGRAYPQACGAWREALSIFNGLDARGKLTDADRKNGMTDVESYLQRNCNGGKPRAGMGLRLDI